MKFVDKKKGSALLISLGVLAILVLYAVTFFTLMSTERSASAGFILQVKAENVAKAGIERALIDLKDAMINERNELVTKDKIYADYNQINNPNGFRHRQWDHPSDSWRYPLSSINSNLSLENVKKVDQLSFHNSKQTGDFEGQPYSGTVGSTYKDGLDYYRLKVLDCSSMIYLNYKNKTNLQRILKNLFTEIGIKSPEAFAEGLAKNRPSDGYKTKQQVLITFQEIGEEESMSREESRKEFNKVRDHITCFAWVDQKQIRPLNAGPPSTKVNHKDDDEKEIFFEPRAPVNVNTAAKPVLFALLSGLQGFHSTQKKMYTITETEARNIAQAIIDHRKVDSGGQKKPFRTWLDFHYFLQNLSLSEEKQHLIKANCNPNVDLNKFEPDNNAKWHFDKTDLVVYSTELTFSSMGYFEITSLGRLVNKKGEVLGQSKVQSVVKLFHVYRDTTQSDFETDRKDVKHQGRHLGIISSPEFSNLRDYPRAVSGKARLGDELRPINQMCNFDGQLVVNGLIRKMVNVDDFLLGFVVNRMKNGVIQPLQGGERSLERVLVPQFYGADAPYNFSHKPPRGSNEDNQESLFQPGSENYFNGHDLDPLGLRITKERGRYYAYAGQHMPLNKGTIEFWVKPHSQFGDGKEFYFHWGRKDKGGDPDRAISIYRETTGKPDVYGISNRETYIKAEFALGWTQGKISSTAGNIGRNNNSDISARAGGRGILYAPAPNGITIKMKVGDEKRLNKLISQHGYTEGRRRYSEEGYWLENEWHHVLVSYGEFNAGGDHASEGRLYVDGKIAPHVAPFGTTSSDGRNVDPITYADEVRATTVKILQKVRIRKVVTNDDGEPIMTEEKDEEGNVKKVPKYEYVDTTFGYTSDPPLLPGAEYEGGVVVTEGTETRAEIPPDRTKKSKESVALWADMRFYIGAKPISDTEVDHFANATIDNFLIHVFFVDQMTGVPSRSEFPPYSRYSIPGTKDPTQLSYGTLLEKRLYALERRGVTLGTAAWTVYPSYYKVPAGEGSGNEEVRLGTRLPGDPYQHMNNYYGGALVTVKTHDPNNTDKDERAYFKGKVNPPADLFGSPRWGAGYSLGGFVTPLKKQIRYTIDFQLAPPPAKIGGSPPPISPPLNATPIFDDLTITYFTTPDVISYQRVE